MLREEDELSETGESEGEDEDEGPGPQGMESDPEVTEVDMSDVDMNKVCCFFGYVFQVPPKHTFSVVNCMYPCGQQWQELQMIC